MKIKALTIQQPYAELIAQGQKMVENRTWSTPYRGPLLIHAGKGMDYLTWTTGPRGIEPETGLRAGEFKFGCLVARCILAGCVSSASIRRGDLDQAYPWIRSHKYVEGPYCFILQNIERLPTPLPFRGAQGLWDVDWSQS